jgi:spore germination protein YaaH
MSKHWLRHFVMASLCGLVPLISVTPVHAWTSPPAKATQMSAIQESAVLQKFRDSGPPAMEQAAAFEATAPPAGRAPATLTGTKVVSAVSNPRLYREVFGFAFASSLGDPNIGYPSWNFGLLSTVAYFGIHVDWTGNFSGGSAFTTWNNPNGPVPGFIQTAHANGTKVVLTIALFDSTSGTPNMCAALLRGSITVRNTVAEVIAKGIDGVNVDYESDNTTCTDPASGAVYSSQSLFTSFVANMRAALPAGSYLSVDTYSGAAGYRDPSGAYLGFFDIGALNNYVDSFFVMAYDMEYANWNAPPLNCPWFCIGPTAPLSTYLFNDSRASSEYRAAVPASKVIMGIPYYGRKECVAVADPSAAPPNAEGTNVGADGYLDASTENGYTGNTQYVMHRETRDALSATRWDTFSSTTAGCNREMYWDDATALGNKYNLIINDHLRGAGIFALNYGGGAPELWSLINLKFGQCSEAALATDHTTPQIPGTSVTFTGSALCAGTGTFRFSMQSPGGSLAVVQNYSTAATWSWNTAGKAPGTYTFQVDARNQGSSVSYDTQARMSFRLALCVTPTLTANPASPQLPGPSITFTSSVTCQGTPEYQFWMLTPGSHTWTIVQPYSSTATFSWNTAGLLGGNYLYTVWVRNTGSAATSCSSLGCNEAYFPGTAYILTTQQCTAVTDSPAPASPSLSSTTVTFTATASGCTNARYQFWMLAPGSHSWTIVQPYSSSATFNWKTTGLPPSTYLYTVWARDTSSAGTACGSLGCNDAYFPGTAYTLTTQPCTSVTDAAAPASTSLSSTMITFTASASGCPNPLYQFWILAPGSHTWTIVRPYASSATFNWDSTGLPAGRYLYTVWVRDSSSRGTSCGSLGCNDAFFPGTAYSLTTQPCASVTDSAAPASPAPAGPTLTFTASASGCPHPLYQFWILAPGSHTWTIMQPYSSSPTFNWNTTGMPAGAYLYTVWVRDSSSAGTSCSSLGCNDAYFPGTAYSLN